MDLPLPGFRPAGSVSVGTRSRQETKWHPRVTAAGIVTEIHPTNVVELGDSVFLRLEI